MSKKNITFNFDISNQNDILVYYYLTKLDTDQVKISCKLKEIILEHINEDDNLKTLLLDAYHNLSESSQLSFMI